MLQLNIVVVDVVVVVVAVVVLDFILLILATISSSQLISLSRVTHTQIGTTKWMNILVLFVIAYTKYLYIVAQAERKWVSSKKILQNTLKNTNVSAVVRRGGN